MEGVAGTSEMVDKVMLEVPKQRGETRGVTVGATVGVVRGTTGVGVVRRGETGVVAMGVWVVRGEARGMDIEGATEAADTRAPPLTWAKPTVS